MELILFGLVVGIVAGQVIDFLVKIREVEVKVR